MFRHISKPIPVALILCGIFINCTLNTLFEEDPEPDFSALALLGAAPAATGTAGSPGEGSTTSSGGTNPEYFVVTSLRNGGGAGEVYLMRRRDNSCLLDLRHNLTVGSNPYDLISDASGTFVYIANAGDSTITPLRVDYTAETLTALSNTTVNGPASTVPYGMAIHPDGRFYVADGNNSGSVGMFNRDSSTGALTGLSPNDYVAAGNNMWYATFDRTSTYLYVSNFNGFGHAGDDTIYAYSVNADGTLSTAGGPFAAQNQPWYIAAHPTRDFLYVSNYGSASVGMYTVNTSTGALTAAGAGNVAASANPIGLAVGENFAFAAASGAGNVHGYSINQSTGELTQVSQLSSLSPPPYGLRLSSDGNCLYVGQGDDSAGTTNDRVSVYNVASDGSLTLAGSINAGVGPRFIEAIRQQ